MDDSFDGSALLPVDGPLEYRPVSRADAQIAIRFVRDGQPAECEAREHPYGVKVFITQTSNPVVLKGGRICRPARVRRTA